MKWNRKGFILLLLIPFYAFSEPGPYFRFIENKNQWPSGIDFSTRVPGGSLSVSAGRFTYSFLDYEKIETLHNRSHSFHETEASDLNPWIDGYSLSVDFVGSNSSAQVSPFGKQSAYYNFFTGKDSNHWASHARAFDGITYQSIYEGIDLKIYSQGRNLKYDFVVAPGYDPSRIAIKYSMANEIYADKGDLIITTPFGDLIEKKPLTYQIISGRKVIVASEFRLCDNVITFSFPNGYDACYELIIDPLLIFSTYSGSEADNWGSTATPGEKGKLYSAGVTNHFVGNKFSGTFPATAGAFQTTYGGVYDVAILKYDSIGQNLLYASYLGGANNESVHSLLMNSKEELIVLGTTSSANFPTTNGAFDESYNGGTPVYERNVEIPIDYNAGSDIFIARISKEGDALLASTYLGGSLNDGLNYSNGPLVVNYGDEMRGDIAADVDGNIYVSTVTSSSDFPAINSFNTTYKGGNSDALILKINPSLTSIAWAGFLGGSKEDAAYTIKFDKENNLVVGGGTISADFPMTSGVYQATHAGDVDGWIAKITSDGSSLLASTYTGTASFNQVYFLDVNQSGDIYVYGQTAGTFPVTNGVYHNSNSGQFVQKFNASLDRLIFSTVFGSGSGLPDISPTAFLVNDCNNIFMTGWGGLVNWGTGHWNTNTIGMPVSDDAFQKNTKGSDFYFIVLTDDARQFLYGTYMGGNLSATHVDGGTSRFDKKGVVYHAVCAGCAGTTSANKPASDFPATENAWSKKNGSLNCNNAAFKFDLSSLKARIQTNSVALNMPGLGFVCLPDSIVFQNRSTGGKIYQWDFGDNTNAILTDTAAITHRYKETGKYTVKLKAFDSGTCIGKDSTYAVVNVYNPLGKIGPGGSFCFGSSFQLSASGGVSYEWTGLKSDFKSAEASPVVAPATDTDYRITVTDFQGCVLRDTVNVIAIPGIDLQFEWSQLFSCNSRPVLTVNNLTNEAEETFWDFGDGTSSDFRNDKHIYQRDSLYSVRLVGKKEYCVYDKKVDVPVYTFFAPNVITPDQSPGENDTFKVLFGNHAPADLNTTVLFTVFDRWGKKVYESKDYRNDWNGNNLTAGVYFYEASIENDALCKGWVQIIR
jgi:hypothetical protein